MPQHLCWWKSYTLNGCILVLMYHTSNLVTVHWTIRRDIASKDTLSCFDCHLSSTVRLRISYTGQTVLNTPRSQKLLEFFRREYTTTISTNLLRRAIGLQDCTTCRNQLWRSCSACFEVENHQPTHEPVCTSQVCMLLNIKHIHTDLLKWPMGWWSEGKGLRWLAGRNFMACNTTSMEILDHCIQANTQTHLHEHASQSLLYEQNVNNAKPSCDMKLESQFAYPTTLNPFQLRVDP